MKACIRCNTMLPLSEYYKHSKMGDGHLNKCKKCCKVRTVWQNIHSRCYDVNCKDYTRYGGRGVYVCDDWHKLVNFEEWYHRSYKEGCQVDRIDNNGPYSPGNCHMVTSAQNCRNRRTTKMTYEILTKADQMYNDGFKLFEISKQLDIHRATIRSAFKGQSWKDFTFSEKIVRDFRF